ncbi:porin [Paraburkholderia sp. BL9I2N2]|uniref:porin n=1 Tax=Paraburkholderia sp. BL9I2N2 TaxID=1938809 RepID=UPI001052E71C|nr:porin [Paraburkholderia sp. BL9I2N2]TCK94652.1 putative porin [Paraburkholderia sp. BL9I2N2]
MERKINAVMGCGVALALGVTPTAHAQSNVMLYGIIDEGLTMITNNGGKHQYLLNSGVLQSSRWGLRGAEDLGAGLKAIFRIESGFDASTGKLAQGGLGFGRQAYVGMQSNYGTVTLGRQYDSVVDFVGPLEAGDQWASSMGAHPGDIDNFNNSYRTNNAIKYASPNYGGFTFGGVYSLGGVAGDYSRNQVWSVGGQYANGPLLLSAAYLNVRNPNVAFFGNSTSGTVSTTTSNVSSPIYGGYGSAHTYQVVGAGGAYTIGSATIGATYSNVKFYGLGSSYASAFAGQTATFNNVEVNFKYQFAPALLVGIAYDYLRGSSINGSSAPRYNQGMAGVDYFLSKRTDIYVVADYQHASGYTANSAGTGVTAAVAALPTLSASSNSNQLAARIGIRHKF